MFDPYKHKIKTVEELRAVIGPRPRTQTVVMCHGAFDIVHPGHIRHLLYAKTHGDILVASVTSDEFIDKGEGRPYVPHELRAANLAALEVVDYVIVDFRPEPLENIRSLQPDCFVKGYEYSAAGVHPKTQKEIEVVSSYGGKFIFSPGDVVYSSTKILAQHKPRLTLEKLGTLMEAEGVAFGRLRKTLESLAGVNVHVVGDTIVDKYSYCALLGPATKTPTFSVRLEQSKTFVGGAGIVAKHLRSLGAEVTLTTVLGEDSLAEMAMEDLKSSGVHVNAVRESHRPTILKERFWAGNYKLLQVDTLDNSPLAARQIEVIQGFIRNLPSDLVVFSDFRHGLFHSDSVKILTEAIPPGSLKVADSQVSSRWGNILDFKGFDLITPNEHEARFALGDQDSGVRSLAQRLMTAARARFVLLKLGARGILAYRSPKSSPRSFFHLDTFVERLVDAVGAGDALLATASLVLARTGDIVQAAILGSLAAAVACEQEGNIPIDTPGVMARLQSAQEMAGWGARRSARRKPAPLAPPGSLEAGMPKPRAAQPL